MPVIMTKQRRRSRRLQTCQVHVSFKTRLAIIGLLGEDGISFISGNGVNLQVHADYSAISGDQDGNGVCDDNEIYCMDETACNYDATATQDTSLVVPMSLANADVMEKKLPTAKECDCAGNQVDRVNAAEGAMADNNENQERNPCRFSP